MKEYFVRFTENINEDIERGTSQNIFSGEVFKGLCAYSLEIDPYDDIKEKGIERAKELTGWNAQGARIEADPATSTGMLYVPEGIIYRNDFSYATYTSLRDFLGWLF